MHRGTTFFPIFSIGASHSITVSSVFHYSEQTVLWRKKLKGDLPMICLGNLSAVNFPLYKQSNIVLFPIHAFDYPYYNYYTNEKWGITSILITKFLYLYSMALLIFICFMDFSAGFCPIPDRPGWFLHLKERA